jgi:hypothetical protein
MNTPMPQRCSFRSLPVAQDLVTYRDFFNQFGKRTPSVLLDELTNLGNRLHFAVTKVRGGHSTKDQCEKICKENKMSTTIKEVSEMEGGSQDCIL